MLVLLLLLAQVQDPLASASPADLERGQRLFRMNCGGCHGMDGSGGSGPALTRSTFKRAPDNAALVELITEGIATAGMPPSWHLLPDGPRQLAAYVRSLGTVKEAAVPGDAEHGRAVYRTSGCAGCHIVRGEGNGLGPELTDIGARRTAAMLQHALTNPGQSSSPAFIVVRARTRDGAEIRGIRLNEDSFTIQIKDARGFHSFRKADLTQLDKQFDQSLMPSFANLASADLQDLVAFLSGLRGEEK